MDNDTAKIIISLLQTQSEKIDHMNDAISAINKSLVGREACSSFREDIYRRIEKVEAVCTTFEAVKDHFVDASDLSDAKVCVLEKQKLETTELGERISAIEDKLKILDLTWDTVRSNKVILSAFGLLIINGVGVYGGRWEEFSQSDMVLLVGVVLTVVGTLCAILYRKQLRSYLPFSF